MAAGAGAIVEAARGGAWARTVLPRVSRTFAINIRVLRGSLGDAVRTAYLMCRVADTLEDVWPGTRWPALPISEISFARRTQR